MNKRLQKRHERQVARAKDKVRVSEPDVRTAEQIKAARELSRPAGGLTSFGMRGAAPSNRVNRPLATGAREKADG